MGLTYGSGSSIRQGYVFGETNPVAASEKAEWEDIPDLIEKMKG